MLDVMQKRGMQSFDVISCQFSLHYFFKDELTLRSFLQNISDNLKISTKEEPKTGFLIGTCYDGKKIFESFKKIKSKAKELKGDGWKIEKKYTARVFTEKKPFGLEITVPVRRPRFEKVL